MEGLVCREAMPEDVDDILQVRNAIFPPLTPEEYLADPTMTCSIAYLDGEPVGAIPLSVRQFRLAPGVVVGAAFENAVGTREDMRSRGIMVLETSPEHFSIQLVRKYLEIRRSGLL